MKIIANTSGHDPSYIVEVTLDELARIGGYEGRYDERFKALSPGLGPLPAGTQIAVADGDALRRAATLDHKARHVAKEMRLMASLLDPSPPLKVGEPDSV